MRGRLSPYLGRPRRRQGNLDGILDRDLEGLRRAAAGIGRHHRDDVRKGRVGRDADYAAGVDGRDGAGHREYERLALEEGFRRDGLHVRTPVEDFLDDRPHRPGCPVRDRERARLRHRTARGALGAYAAREPGEIVWAIRHVGVTDRAGNFPAVAAPLQRQIRRGLPTPSAGDHDYLRADLAGARERGGEEQKRRDQEPVGALQDPTSRILSSGGTEPRPAGNPAIAQANRLEAPGAGAVQLPAAIAKGRAGPPARSVVRRGRGIRPLHRQSRGEAPCQLDYDSLSHPTPSRRPCPMNRRQALPIA